MKFTVINLGITCLLGSLTPGLSQDAAMAMQSKPIWLKIGKDGKFLGENKDDFATMNKEPGDYVFWSTLGGDPAKSLEHGQSYKIQMGDMFLYCTAKGNAGLYKTAKDEASSWTIEKQKQQSNNDDNVIRHGDVIKLRNGYWKTSFLYDNGNGYAAAGNYPDKPQEWHVDWRLTKVQRAIMPQNVEIITNALYISNIGGPASAAAKETISLSIADTVGVSKMNSKEWSASLAVTVETDSGSGVGAPSTKFSATATAAYGGALAEEITSAKAVTQGKTVETTYDRPNNCEVLLLTRLAVPFQNFELSCEGLETVKMRSVMGSISITGMTAIYIPRYNEGKLDVVPEADVMNALDYLGRSDPAEAGRLRKERVPIWKKNGWVSNVPKALVLAPGSEMIVKQQYWSENKQFYAIFQPDGNAGINNKDGGYKYDVVTWNQVPLGAKRLKLESTGDLVFLGPNNEVIWSISKIITPVPNSTLNISNSGELLLLTPDGGLLWKSSK